MRKEANAADAALEVMWQNLPCITTSLVRAF